MYMSEEDWVQAAMADNSMVADLLIILQATVVQKNSEDERFLLQFLPLDWRVRRQPHSKPTTDSKKISTSTVSPSTPLSWSGGGTATESAAALDGFEESSRPPPDSSRSEIIIIKEEGSTPTRRIRKKKSLAKLKEEEVLLISERTYLTKELAAVHLNLENQRATNQTLKSLKVDIEGGGDTGSCGRSYRLPDLNIPLEIDDYMN